MRKRQLRVINSSCVYDIHSVVFIGCCGSARSVESVERSDGYMFGNAVYSWGGRVMSED